MLSKIKYILITFIGAAVVLWPGSFASGDSETLSIGNYYPSPSGIYDRVRLVPKESDFLPCDASTEGAIYFDRDNDTLYVCGRDTNYFPLAGLWTHVTDATGDIIHLVSNDSYENLRVGIGTTDPVMLLHIDGVTIPNDYAGIAVESNLDTTASTFPGNVDGAGSKLIWYPALSYFCAGHFSADQCDSNKITRVGISMGNDTVASNGGFGSVAIGDKSQALAFNAVAIGLAIENSGTNFPHIADGLGAISLGRANVVSSSRSVALGSLNTAGGSLNVLIGSGVHADPSADDVVMIGRQMGASGEGGVSIGWAADESTTENSSTGKGGVFIGSTTYDDAVTAEGGVSIGLNPLVDGSYSFLAATTNPGQSRVLGNSSTLICTGNNPCFVNADHATAIGGLMNIEDTATHSIAFNAPTVVSSSDSVVFNLGLPGNGSIQGMNRNNTFAIMGGTTVGLNTVNPTTDLHLYGDGSGPSELNGGIISEGVEGAGHIHENSTSYFLWYPRKSAIRVGDSGGIGNNNWFDANIGLRSAYFGIGGTARGESAFSAGGSNQADGFASLALGHLSLATGDYSTTLGESVIASGTNTTAVGHGVEASGDYSVAIALNDQTGTNISQANTLAIMGGNVGIENYSPAHALDVSGGDINASCLRRNTSPVGGSCVSDVTLKKNIKPLTGSLEKLTRLNPIRFTYTDEKYGRGVNHGLSAQEVENVYPSWVTEGTDGYKRVHYNVQTQMHLIQAIKELKSTYEEELDHVLKENEMLKERIKTLKDKIL